MSISQLLQSKRSQIIQIAARHGAQKVRVFGSVVRGDARPDSDIDFLVATTEPAPIVEWFVTQPGIKEVTARGESKASVRLESGLQADLRLVPPEQFVFTLHHLTGSKDHNVQMRQRALARGLSMSEWGLFPSDQKHGPTEQGAGSKEQGVKARNPTSKLPAPSSVLPAVKTEADLFKALPELTSAVKG